MKGHSGTSLGDKQNQGEIKAVFGGSVSSKFMGPLKFHFSGPLLLKKIPADIL